MGFISSSENILLGYGFQGTVRWHENDRTDSHREEAAEVHAWSSAGYGRS
jgi:hypothetical protein